jgi:Fe-S cluster biogenesis protein NfuA
MMAVSYLEEIEQLLDDTVRPYLWDDGGDVKLLFLDKNKLHIEFTGACRDCPHSGTTTFEAIKNVIQQHDQTLELINDTP